MKGNSAWMLAVTAAGLAAIAIPGLRATGAGTEAGGMTAFNAAPKTAVALVNLEILMTKLDETKGLNDELESTRVARNKEIEDLTAKMKTLEQDVKLLPEGSKEWRSKWAVLKETELTREARGKVLMTITAYDKGELVAAIYDKITTAIATFAQKEGFDLVLLDDRGITLPKGTQNEVNSAIQAKRVLFAVEGLDVTERIATLMNAEYSAPAKKR